MNEWNKDSISRIAVAFLEKDPEFWKEYGDKALEMIGAHLNSYKLKIVCSASIENSAAEQAALLTAINVGKRCYKGGVYVDCSQDVELRIPWPGVTNIHEAVREIGGCIWEGEICTVVISIGGRSSDESWTVLVNTWCAGVIPPGLPMPSFQGDQSFPLGGVLGGALVVGMTFLRVAGFNFSIGRDVVGLSLWRPDLEWHNPAAQGPVPSRMASKFWMLGLGHLGQAYAWVLGLLPYQDPKEITCVLQDFDRVVVGNLDAAMLCNSGDVGLYKTRVVSDWIEKRGMQTIIIERPYRSNFPSESDDPVVMLAGLDNLESRKALQVRAGSLLLDVGLGSGLDFDLIRFHAFPNNSTTPAMLWKDATATTTTPAIKELTQKYAKCGITLGVSSAFTGCVAACITVSEILRSTMQGVKLAHFFGSIGELLEYHTAVAGVYGTEVKTWTVGLHREK